MPAYYEGAILRSQGTPILDLHRPAGTTDRAQRQLLDTLREYQRDHLDRCAGNPALAARIASYELAYRMQTAAPEAVDLAQESERTRTLYGIGNPRTEAVGRQCLLARRLVERGVRFIQIYSGGNHNDANWDAHGDLVMNHNMHAGETDLPIAGLLRHLPCLATPCRGGPAVNESGLLLDASP
jgi:hypothetical protein